MGRRPDWVDGGLYPFADHWREIDGNEVHYLDVGEGPTLLFLHGNPTWSFLYRNVIDGLHRRYRCVAPDYPGFGLSRAGWNHDGSPASHADVVERLVLELDLRDVTLVIHDWGGPIGFAVAGRHPDRFHGFVIGNTWAWPLDREPRVAAFSRLVGNRVSQAAIQWGNLLVNLALPLATHTSLDVEVMRHYREPFTRKEDRRFTAVLSRALLGADELNREAARALVAMSDRPALLLWGERDPLFRGGHRRRFENAFPHHRTWRLEDAGHYLWEDAPDDVVSAIHEWHRERFPDPLPGPRSRS